MSTEFVTLTRARTSIKNNQMLKFCDIIIAFINKNYSAKQVRAKLHDRHFIDPRRSRKSRDVLLQNC